jgi:cobyric acid synthase
VRVLTAGFIGGAEDAAFDAYEIHVGQTRRDASLRPFAKLTAYGSRGSRFDGAVSADGLVIGTYAHGLFTDQRMRNALLTALAVRRGQVFVPLDLPHDPYARISRWLRGSVDVADLLARCGVTRAFSGSPPARAEVAR